MTSLHQNCHFFISQVPLVARFGFLLLALVFLDVFVSTLHCSFWIFVGTKNQNQQQKTKQVSNGNQTLLSAKDIYSICQ